MAFTVDVLSNFSTVSLQQLHSLSECQICQCHPIRESKINHKIAIYQELYLTHLLEIVLVFWEQQMTSTPYFVSLMLGDSWMCQLNILSSLNVENLHLGIVIPSSHTYNKLKCLVYLYTNFGCLCHILKRPSLIFFPTKLHC